ncbi:MAG: 2-hydroxyglutaryl-CoA dehydratase [bacterium]|nr:MAG: 2-hydroxyglutaryl-CoA dehydratase [bacterium]
MTQKEYWRWDEKCWKDESMDSSDVKIISVGIDIGSVSSEAAICLDGKFYASNTVRTGSNSPTSAKDALKPLLEHAEISYEAVDFIVGTGYGRVNIPFQDKAVTEIACHGRGANYMVGPSLRTILDMGGQDCKAIHIDERGKVTNFLMNDKCAAGTGRGMETIADLLKVPITEIGDRSFQINAPAEPISNVCVVFAKSEAMAMVKSGKTLNEVLASYCKAMADRVTQLLDRIGMEKEFFITGGISKNRGVTERIEENLGIEAVKPKDERFDAQTAGALGAALFGFVLASKKGSKKDTRKGQIL